MKNLVTIFAIGVFLLSLFAVVPSAWARPAFEDPQLCVNGKLLVVNPTTAPVDVWVHVGKNVQVDTNVANCGGDPNLPVVQRNHIFSDGDLNFMLVAAHTKPRADIDIQFGNKDKTYDSGWDGWVLALYKVK